MKIAFCLFKYFPHGGLQRDFFRIATLCLKHGHEVHVYTMQWEGEHPSGFHLHLIPTHKKQNHSRAQAFNQFIQQCLSNVHYDLVIGFNKMAGLDIYYAADRCYKHLTHSFLTRLLPRYQTYKKLEQAVFKVDSPTEILLISPREQAIFHRHYQTQPHRFHLLPPGLDPTYSNLDRAHRQQIRQAMGLTAHSKVLLQVGSGYKTKGVDRSIIAFSSLPSALRSQSTLLIVGKGDSNHYEQLAKKMHVTEQVKFLGAIDQIKPLYFAADLLLHPSLHENTGTVLLEAMTCGLAVLTTDACGYAHYIKAAEAGVVLSAAPFRQTEFNLALKRMLMMPNPNWTGNGLRYAQEHDFYGMPNKIMSIIEKIGKARGSASE